MAVWWTPCYIIVTWGGPSYIGSTGVRGFFWVLWYTGSVIGVVLLGFCSELWCDKIYSPHLFSTWHAPSCLVSSPLHLCSFRMSCAWAGLLNMLEHFMNSISLFMPLCVPVSWLHCACLPWLRMCLCWFWFLHSRMMCYCVWSVAPHGHSISWVGTNHL